MMGIPTNSWYDLPYTVLMFYQTSSQEVLHMEPIIDKFQELFSCKKNANIMCVGDTILDAAAESGIGENMCLLEN